MDPWQNFVFFLCLQDLDHVPNYAANVLIHPLLWHQGDLTVKENLQFFANVRGTLKYHALTCLCSFWSKPWWVSSKFSTNARCNRRHGQWLCSEHSPSHTVGAEAECFARCAAWMLLLHHFVNYFFCPCSIPHWRGNVKSDSPRVQAVWGMGFLSFLRLSGGMRRRLAVGPAC